jgi:hypothetical protein
MRSRPNSNSDWSSHQPSVESGVIVGDFRHHPGDVGDLGTRLGQHGRRLFVALTGVVGGEEFLVEALVEAQGSTPEGVHGMVAEVVGEPALGEDARQRVHVPQQCRGHGGSDLDHSRCPGMAEQDPAGRQDLVTQDALPVTPTRLVVADDPLPMWLILAGGGVTFLGVGASIRTHDN